MWLRIERRVKSGTTPITSDGAAGGGPERAPLAKAAVQRDQEMVLPTASWGVLNPSLRAPVSLSTSVGWFAMPSPIRSSTTSWPRFGSKNRPARGFSPCISKKPTSTAAMLTDIGGWPGRMALLCSWPSATTTWEAQATCLTPGRAATWCFMALSQGALMRRIWSVSSRTASVRAKEVCR